MKPSPTLCWALVILVFAPQAFAHRSGCHERFQAYGNVSKQHLSALVFSQNVTVDYHKTDRYGRTVGTVVVNGRDVNLQQVRAGLAWHYKQYEDEQIPKDRAAYAQAELSARKNRLGLWRDLNPIPPWEFRRRRR
jgi:endonuclease YncB( thermonuclease family)